MRKRVRARLSVMLGLALMLAACGPGAGVGDAAATQPGVDESMATDDLPNAASTNATIDASANDSTSAEVAYTANVTIEGTGLRVYTPDNAAARPIPFGMSQAQTLAALAFRGKPETSVNSECGAGPVDYASWRDGFSLLFQEGKFVGWNVDERSGGKIITTAGIGPGATRAELAQAYDIKVEETTLGTEFTADALSGVLSGPDQTSTIADMWAGVNCVFR